MSVDWPLVKSGGKGKAVKALQRLLLHRGADIEVDGAFGPATAKAVTAFQKANGLAADGMVGNDTWSSSRNASSADGIVGPHTWQLLLLESRR